MSLSCVLYVPGLWRLSLSGAWVDTHTYQASSFYEKQDFERFGLIDEHPPGHSRIFLGKRFLSSGPEQ